MIDTGKVALVACGGLRQFSKCYHTWNIFPQQHNYVLTWDIDYMTVPYGHFFHPTVTKTHDLINAKAEGHIKDYEIFIESPNLKQRPRFKNLFLWSQIEPYISYDYDYVLITRPDTMFYKNTTDRFRLPVENEIHVTWINEENLSVSDGEFFMSRSTLKKFAEIYQYSVEMEPPSEEENNINRQFYCAEGPHTHMLLYNFCKDKNIKLTKMMNEYTDSVLYRIGLKINDTPTIHDLRNEMFREFTIQQKHGANNYLPKAILIISNKFLSGNDRKLIIENVVDPKEKELLNKYMYFESYDSKIGVKKIKDFEKDYNIKFSEILTVQGD